MILPKQQPLPFVANNAFDLDALRRAVHAMDMAGVPDKGRCIAISRGNYVELLQSCNSYENLFSDPINTSQPPMYAGVRLIVK